MHIYPPPNIYNIKINDNSMDNFKIISQALSQNNADINNLSIKINKIDTSKEDSFIVLNTDALAGLELPENITAPELSTDVVLDLFGFDNISTLYYAIPNFDNKIFVLKATLETFKVGSTSYMITNCAPCIGKMIPYAGNNILMLTFLFNTANDYVRIMTLYVDGESSTNVKGRISIKELSSGSSGDTPNLDEYITETELNGKGYATSSYVDGELAKKSDTGHTHSQYLTEHQDISGKQDVISDLDTIRSGAAKGATALQSVPSEYITETELNARGYATTANVNAEIDTVNQTMGGLATRLTNVENLTSHDMRASVLWLGTSIPAGDISIDPQQNNTYPKMVADALGFDLYNMAKAGSFVSWYPQAPAWTTSAQVAAEFATAYCLSATRQEIYDKYYNVLETIRRNERLSTTWRDDYLNDFMDSSFETRIIPYIDGTIAKCDGVVIDHGFNDRGNIFAVCQQHVTEDKDSISVWGPGSGADGVEYPVIGGNAGWWWLTHLADNRYYDGEVYMNTVYAVANGLAGNDTGGMRGEYFGAMAYIIAKIQQIDPRIRIVIGNYFSQDYGTAIGDGMNSFQTKYILQANQSIADYYGFPCVNVYKHTGLRNRTIRKPDGTTISDMFWFCPDGVHPSSDTTGLSNTIIASAYVAQIKGCFFKLG